MRYPGSIHVASGGCGVGDSSRTSFLAPLAAGRVERPHRDRRRRVRSRSPRNWQTDGRAPSARDCQQFAALLGNNCHRRKAAEQTNISVGASAREFARERRALRQYRRVQRRKADFYRTRYHPAVASRQPMRRKSSPRPVAVGYLAPYCCIDSASPACSAISTTGPRPLTFSIVNQPSASVVARSPPTIWTVAPATVVDSAPETTRPTITATPLPSSSKSPRSKEGLDPPSPPAPGPKPRGSPEFPFPHATQPVAAINKPQQAILRHFASRTHALSCIAPPGQKAIQLDERRIVSTGITRVGWRRPGSVRCSRRPSRCKSFGATLDISFE